MSSLAGTVAVVTGAGSGIGRATASLLAEQGCQVVAADINLTAAQETVATSSGDVIAAEVDVRDETLVQGLLDREAQSFGREAGVLANIAGIGSTTVDSPWLQRLIDEAGESRADLVQRQPMGRLRPLRR